MDAIDTAWAASLGCEVADLSVPGVHLVPGGPELAAYRGIYAARFGPAVLLYCPAELIERVRMAVAEADPDAVFRPAGLRRLAGLDDAVVLGPSRHGFVDAAHFRPVAGAAASRLAPDDPALGELRRACGEGDWAESGFAGVGDDPLYGVKEDRRLVVAGNMTPYRAKPADVGVLTHPDHRGRGLARLLASEMVAEALPVVGLVRYRALLANVASLSVAAGLGFVPRGENLALRLDQG